MSNNEARQDDRDARLSAAWRELSDETTPPALDRRILAEAAREAALHDERGPRWTQPLAWAAIIVVTVTILLMLSDLPVPPDGMPAPTPAGQAPPGRAPEFRELSPGRADADRSFDERNDDERGAAGAPAPESGRWASSAGDSRPEPRQEAATVPDAGTRAPAASRKLAAPAELGAVARDQAPSCDDEARSTPETWRDCIAALREAGRIEAADAELEALNAAFPDSTPP